MGMCLSTYVIYGWHIGSRDKVSFPKDFDYYDFSEDELEYLNIEAIHYHDYMNYYLVIKEVSKSDSDPINIGKVSKPNLKERDIQKIQRDIEKVKERIGFVTKGDPAFYACSQYF